MNKTLNIILSICFIGVALCAKAQVLDDEISPSSQDINGALLDETAKDEALFDEIFSEYSESDKDINNIKTIEAAVGQAAKNMQQPKSEASENKIFSPYDKVEPLQGEMRIGISSGSFNIYRGDLGNTACSFSVTLRSDLSRDIKVMGLNLVYPKRSFAFVFRGVPKGGVQEHFIRTSGDICYNITGVPDIKIDICRIRAASGKECAARLRWDDKIKAPEHDEDFIFGNYK